MADKYILKVTAGPDYDEKNQQTVFVNSESACKISSSKLDADVKIRVQNYRGLPKDSPQTSPYFSKDPHKSDLYSLAFDFVLKDDVNGHDLVFGNDFDHPIRDKLPPGFSQAMKIVQWFIDPGLYGDAYADEPYLYGPFLSSINTLRIGSKNQDEKKKESDENEDDNDDEGVLIITEGADADGKEARDESGIPADAAARKKHFLKEQNLKNFNFEKGRTYSADFYNPYLDFNDFALKLPGFSLVPGITIPVISYWDGQPLRSHTIRYVLRNRATDEVLFVVIFTLLPKDQLENKKDEGEEEEKKKEEEQGKKTAAAGENEDLD